PYRLDRTLNRPAPSLRNAPERPPDQPTQIPTARTNRHLKTRLKPENWGFKTPLLTKEGWTPLHGGRGGKKSSPPLRRRGGTRFMCDGAVHSPRSGGGRSQLSIPNS